MQDGVAELLFGSRCHLAAKLVNHCLHTVADTQDWKMLLKDPVWYPGGSLFIDAGWAT